MRDNFVEAIKQQHDDTWMEKDGLVKKIDRGGSHQEILERAKGIEPSYRAWEALVLPLNYARFEVCKAL